MVEINTYKYTLNIEIVWILFSYLLTHSLYLSQGLYRPSSLDNLNDRMDRSTQGSIHGEGASSSDEEEPTNTLSPSQPGIHEPPHTHYMHYIGLCIQVCKLSNFYTDQLLH